MAVAAKARRAGDRRRRRNRRRDCSPVRPRRFCRLRDATFGRQAATPGRFHPRRRRRGARLRFRRAKEDEVAALVEDIESRIGDIDVFVFNIGANVPCSVLDESARKYFKIWEMACYSGFLTGQAVAKRMVARRRGTMISRVPRRACAAPPVSRRLPAPSTRCAPWPRACRGNSGRQRARRARDHRRRDRHRVHPRQLS